jgi:hypothetical protein
MRFRDSYADFFEEFECLFFEWFELDDYMSIIYIIGIEVMLLAEYFYRFIKKIEINKKFSVFLAFSLSTNVNKIYSIMKCFYNDAYTERRFLIDD